MSYNPNNGYFLFSRGGGKSSADFNPAVLSGAVNSQVGAYSAINETFSYAFRHADYSFMPLPKKIRTFGNQYAISDPIMFVVPVPETCEDNVPLVNVK